MPETATPDTPALTPTAADGPPPGASIWVRARKIRCRDTACRTCPHGPYYYLRWSTLSGGRKRFQEQYLGRIPQGWKIALFANTYRPMPEIGTILPLPEGTVWTTADVAKPIWFAVASMFRVDGHGVSRMGGRHALTAWVTLRTMDDRITYRQARYRVPVGEDTPTPPGDPRWPVRLLTFL